MNLKKIMDRRSKIKAMLLVNGMSQRLLAKRLGVHPVYLNGVINKRRPLTGKMFNYIKKILK